MSKQAQAVQPNGEEKLVTLAEICKRKKVKGVMLRRALRASKIAKPSGTWRWPVAHKDVKAVEKLADELKK